MSKWCLNLNWNYLKLNSTVFFSRKAHHVTQPGTRKTFCSEWIICSMQALFEQLWKFRIVHVAMVRLCRCLLNCSLWSLLVWERIQELCAVESALTHQASWSGPRSHLHKQLRGRRESCLQNSQLKYTLSKGQSRWHCECLLVLAVLANNLRTLTSVLHETSWCSLKTCMLPNLFFWTLKPHLKKIHANAQYVSVYNKHAVQLCICHFKYSSSLKSGGVWFVKNIAFTAKHLTKKTVI